MHARLATTRFIAETLLMMEARMWYSWVGHENFLHKLLVDVNGDSATTQRQRGKRCANTAWRCKLTSFLKKIPFPCLEELVHLAHMSNSIPDEELHQAAKRMYRLCMDLRKLLITSGPMTVIHLRIPLQCWYELLRSNDVNHSSGDKATNRAPKDIGLDKCEIAQEATDLLGTSPLIPVSRKVFNDCEPSFRSSFDLGFDETGNAPMEASIVGLSRLSGTKDSMIPLLIQPQIHTDGVCSVSNFEDRREEFAFGCIGSPPRINRIKTIIPKVTIESLNLDLKMALLPSNPCLNLPVDDMENLCTSTIAQNPSPQKRELQFHDPSEPWTTTILINKCRDQHTRTEVFNSTQFTGSHSRGWILHSQTSLEDSELEVGSQSSICNILSSTIPEGRKSIYTTAGIPTLLWDSYDLHDYKEVSIDGLLDVPLNDWDVKEQDDLRELEKILDGADQILAKEENSLSSEEWHNSWLWDSENQLGAMSSSELVEAAVRDFEDYIVSAISEDLCKLGSTGLCDNDGHCTEAADMVAFHSRLELLKELRKVNVLDDLIMGEGKTIHMLECCKERMDKELHEDKVLDTNRLTSVCKEREAFWLRLEKEKWEAERLENSLNEWCKVEEHKIEKRADGGLPELLSGSSNRSQRTHTTSLLHTYSQAQENCPSQYIPAVSSPGVAKKPGLQGFAQLLDSYQDQDHCSEPEMLVLNSTTSYLKELPKKVGIQSWVCVYVKECDRFDENSTVCKPEASLTAETRPDDEEFDPGGKSLLSPVLKQRKSLLPVNDNHETEQQIPALSSVGSSNTDFVFLEKFKLSLDHLKLADFNPAGEIQTISPVYDKPQNSEPQLPHDWDLEYDANGKKEKERLPSGVQTFEALRMSASEPPLIQTHLHINRREMTDFKTIVLDIGSSLINAGFVDQDLPNIIFPTFIEMPKYKEMTSGNFERETYIGHEAQHMRGVLTLTDPIKNEAIHNWDEMDKIWHHAFQQLCVDPACRPVLLTEAAMNPLEKLQRMVKIIFESFGVSFTYVAMQPVLALYAAGRTSDVFFESGDGVSHSVPVVDDYSLPHAVQRFPMSGLDALHLKKLLQEQGVCMYVCTTAEIVKEMKEKYCCVALNYKAEPSTEGKPCREMHFTMLVTLSTEKFRVPEILADWSGPLWDAQEHLQVNTKLRHCPAVLHPEKHCSVRWVGLPERLEMKGLDCQGQECLCHQPQRQRLVGVERRGSSFSSAWISQEV